MAKNKENEEKLKIIVIFILRNVVWLKLISNLVKQITELSRKNSMWLVVFISTEPLGVSYCPDKSGINIKMCFRTIQKRLKKILIKTPQGIYIN